MRVSLKFKQMRHYLKFYQKVLTTYYLSTSQVLGEGSQDPLLGGSLTFTVFVGRVSSVGHMTNQ